MKKLNNLIIIKNQTKKTEALKIAQVEMLKQQKSIVMV